MATFNRDKAAQCLVDAILMGDKEAAAKYNVTTRTLENWRSRLESDKDFSSFFQKIKRQKDETWADELPAALTSCIQFLKEAAQQASRTDPNAIAAISQAAETLSDIALTSKVVDERLAAARAENEAD